MSTEKTSTADAANTPAPSERFENFRSFLASGLASCLSDTAVAPLERVKTLFQGHHEQYHSMGVKEAMKKIHQTEGFRGFYRGNGAMMLLTFPYSAIQSSTYDETKKFIQQKKGKEQNHADRLLAASVAGVTTTVATYPMELIRTRLTFQTKGQEVYSGIYDCIKSIYTKEGLRSFYKGLTPTLMAGAPYAALSYFSYDTLKNVAVINAPKYCAKISVKKDKLSLNAPASMICGGLSGAITTAIVYPLDVVASNMQVEDMRYDNVKPKTMLQTFKSIYDQHGIWRGLFRGVSISCMRAIPASAVFFTAQDLLRQLFCVDK